MTAFEKVDHYSGPRVLPHGCCACYGTAGRVVLPEDRLRLDCSAEVITKVRDTDEVDHPGK